MKKINYLLMTAAVMTTACSNIELEEFVPNSMKNQITFSGESNTSSRAGLHQSAPTQVIMHIKSEGPAENAVRVTRTQANATKDEEQSATSYSSVVFDDSYKRYWDDAYGRDAKLSVYAFAVPGKTSTDDTQVKEALLAAPEKDKTWSNTDLAHTVAWNVSTTQTEESILNEDLIYSNNISGDNKLKFNLEDPKDTDGPGKFEQGNLQFKHALARITVNLNKGKGFAATNCFNFTGGNNVTLYNIPTSATLDLTNGTWSNATSNTVASIYEKSSTDNNKHELMAQVIPGAKYTKGSNANAMSFIIDDNQYYITYDMMYKALNTTVNATSMTKLTNTDVTLENGLNYIFNINVNKTAVTMTATVEGWTDITAKITDPSNARITLNLLNNGTESNDVKFYRSAITTNDFKDPEDKNWKTGYEVKGDNAWYFENNKTYYHFRATNKNAVVTKDAENGDYFPIAAGTTDYLWGAPINSSTTPAYNVTNGYADAINPAIGATTNAITMTQFHMMSKITINLTTTKGETAVDLTGSEVTITRIDNNGKVLMGSGLITLSGSTTDVVLNKAENSYTYTLNVIPQLLERKANSTDDNDYIGISIKTATGQSMYFKERLSNIKAATVAGPQHTVGQTITRWYPGHTYTYTFNLTKTGIKDMKASVVDWIKINAETQNISLEK
jgi:hypothetical protein